MACSKASITFTSENICSSFVPPCMLQPLLL